MNRGIGVGIGIGFGSNAGGGGGIEEYLLRTAFPLATGQPIALADGVTYTDADGANPVTWMDEGELTLNIPVGGAAQIDADALSFPSDIPLDGDDLMGALSQSLALNDGIMCCSKVKYYVGAAGTTRGFFTGASVDGTNVFASSFIFNIFTNTTTPSLDSIAVFTVGGGSNITLVSVEDVFADGEEVSCVVAFKPSTGDVFFYIKSATAYPEWNLLYVASGETISGLYQALWIRAGLFKYTEAETPIATNLAAVSSLLTLTTSIQAAVANVYIKGVFTTPGSGTTPFEIKFRQSDANNYWLVKILPGTAGVDLSLHTVEAGVEQAALATADVDFAVSTEYTIDIRCNGDDDCQVLIDGVSKLDLSTTETFNLTETGVSQVEASFTGISLQAYQQERSDL